MRCAPDFHTRRWIQDPKPVPLSTALNLSLKLTFETFLSTVSLGLAMLVGDGRKRQAVLQATQRALARIASFEAPRCCRRESWLALQETSRFLRETLGKNLKVDFPFTRDQVARNHECIRERCPLWPGNRGNREASR